MGGKEIKGTWRTTASRQIRRKMEEDGESNCQRKKEREIREDLKEEGSVEIQEDLLRWWTKAAAAQA